MNLPSHLNEHQPAYGELPTGIGINLQGSLAALRRAALQAQQVAQQTGTDLIVQRDGQMVRIKPKQSGAS